MGRVGRDLRSGALALVLGAAVACGSSSGGEQPGGPDGETCSPGSVRTCYGLGCPAEQVCDPGTSTWSECTCGGAGTSGSGGGGMGGGPGGSGGISGAGGTSLDGGCEPTAETCDGIDNDCDGQIDDGATCSDPLFSCQGGQCACLAANLCDGACVDLSTSSTHCGACNHDCGGAACETGKCKPLSLVKENAAGLRLKADQGAVFWLTDSSVRALQATNFEQTLAANVAPTGSMAVNATHVYYAHYDAAGDEIRRLPRTGGSMVVVASGLKFACDMALDASFLYFAEQSNNALKRVSLSGGTPTTIATLTIPCDMALGDGFVYVVAEAKNVYRVPVAGGSSSVVVQATQNVSDVAVDATTLYYLLANGDVMAMPLLGGPVVKLTGETSIPYRLLASATRVFWSTNTGIRSIAKGGGAVAQHTSASSSDFDVEGSFIYYFEDYSGLWRVSQ